VAQLRGGKILVEIWTGFSDSSPLQGKNVSWQNCTGYKRIWLKISSKVRLGPTER